MTRFHVLPRSSQRCKRGANVELCVWWFRLRFFMVLGCCVVGGGAKGPVGGLSRSYWMSEHIEEVQFPHGPLITCRQGTGFDGMALRPVRLLV